MSRLPDACGDTTADVNNIVHVNKNNIVIPHSALLKVTGWASAAEGGIRIGHLHVRTRWRPQGESQRVTALTYPRTRPDGTLVLARAFASNVRRAKAPNGTELRVTGQLIRLDPAERLVKVRVFPAQADTEPFMVHALATRAVLAADPGVFHVTLTGQLLPTGHLLAETLTPVHAPLPARWQGWEHRPGRRRRLAQTAS